MKNILLMIFSFLTLLLTACTSQEGQLKKQAQEQGEKKFAEMIQKEAEESLGQSEWLRQAYTEFIQNKSEVEVDEVKMQGEKLATVSVTVTTYPVKIRRMLLGIAGKVDSTKSRRFNFAEATSLVTQQMGEKNETVKQPLETYRFSQGSEKWILQQ